MNLIPSQNSFSNAAESPKAIALLSGGLDSALAAALVKSWGIKTIGLHLTSPFSCLVEVEEVAQELNIKLVIKDKGEAFVDLVGAPKYGYGSQMNPCIDCRIYMFDIAEKVLKAEKADFIVTGEVVGQRPLSQTKSNITFIEKKSPLEHRVLRPLCGGNLPPTLAEEKGWIQREQLLKISGRGRTEQLALAKKLGISAFSSPGGGCLLTEAAFSERLKDFYTFTSYRSSEEKMAQAKMLRLGRHFKIDRSLKVIVARTDSETQEITALWPSSGATLYEPINYKGPVAVSFGILSLEHKTQISGLLARYGRRNHLEPFITRLKTQFSSVKQIEELLQVETPVAESTLNSWRIGTT